MNKRKITIHFALASVILASVLLPGMVFGGGPARPNTQSSSQEKTAQKAERRASLENLTNKLVAHTTKVQQASQTEQFYLEDNLPDIAAMRQLALAQIIEGDPAEVLRVAVPTSIRASMPFDVQGFVEQHMELEGELEVYYEDWESGSRLLYFLEAAGERYSLHFANGHPTHLMTGAHIRIKGVRVGQAIALDSSGDDLISTSGTGFQTLASVQPNTFGEQKVLVILVNFQDKQTQPFSINQVRDLVFGTVNDFYKESSYQQTWLTGDVYGWYTMPITSTSCSNSTIATYAKQAATAAGVNLSAYNRYVYAFPSISCGWTGWGTYGGNPSQAWINGSMSLRTVGHELGHNFGLYHAQALECGSEVVGNSCSKIEYGDTLDILGKSGVTGYSNSYQKERLGWLDYGSSPGITTVQGSGSYWIDPYEALSFNPKALKILKSIDSSTGRKTYYYVEFRRPMGFDSFISSNSNVMNGVVIHQGTESLGPENYLLDMTPETPSWSDPALVVGRSFNDPDSGVTITPVSVGNTGASVNVSFGPQPCVQANPSATPSPSESQWVAAGTTVTYTISVTNNDSGGCAASGFNLQAAVPEGWTATFASPTLNISPGSSSVTTLQVTSPSWATDGFYDVGVTATKNSGATYSASTSMTYVIVSSLNVSVSTDQASYTRSQTASMTATVSVGGSPASGVSATFTMRKSNGDEITRTISTGADGSAVYSYRFNKKKDPVGTYQVNVTANLNALSGQAATTFTVR